MSHPQTAIHTAFGIAFFWLFTKHSWKKLLQTFVLAMLAGLVSAPWWLTVYLQHGLAPFLDAAGSGVHDAFPLNVFVSDLFARDTFIPILIILRVSRNHLGGGSSPLRSRPLGGSRLLSGSAQHAGTTSFLAFSLLCGIGFADALPFVINWLKTKSVVAVDFIKLRWFNATLVMMMFYLFLECRRVFFCVGQHQLAYARTVPGDAVGE